MNFKISKKTLMYILIILPVILPIGIYQIPSFAFLARVKYISFVCVVFLSVHKRLYRDKIVVAFISFCSILLLSTIHQSLAILECISLIADIMTPVLWMALLHANNDDIRVFRALDKYLIFILLINLITALIWSDGIYHLISWNKGIFLLGDKNKIGEYSIPAMVILLRNRHSKGKQSSRLFIYIICVLTCVLVDSTTTLLATLLVILLYEISIHSSQLKNFFSFRKLLVILVVAILLIVTQSFTSSVIWQNIASYIGRSANFSGRGTLWNQALNIISQSLWIGYGMASEVQRSFYFTTSSGIVSGFSAHNGYLNLLLDSGIIGLVLYLYIFLTLSQKCTRVWNKSKNVNLFVFGIFGVLIIFIMEAEYYSNMFLILIMLCWLECKKILKMK